MNDNLDVDAFSNLPASHELTWFKCASCQNLHVILQDEVAVPFATATISEDMLSKMLAVVRGAEVQ